MENSGINAQWARETATKVLGDKVKKQIEQCENSITQAVKSNSMSCDVGIYADDLTILELTKRGFTCKKVTGHDQRDDDYLTISC
jgi:hypothetical protein